MLLNLELNLEMKNERLREILFKICFIYSRVRVKTKKCGNKEDDDRVVSNDVQVH